MPDKMWMKKNYNPKNFAGMLLRIKIGRMKLYFVLLMKSHLQSYPCPLQINSIFFFLVVGQQEMSLMNRLCRNSFSSTGIRFHSFLTEVMLSHLQNEFLNLISNKNALEGIKFYTFQSLVIIISWQNRFFLTASKFIL